jgi:hypothetical protein
VTFRYLATVPTSHEADRIGTAIGATFPGTLVSWEGSGSEWDRERTWDLYTDASADTLTDIRHFVAGWVAGRA